MHRFFVPSEVIEGTEIFFPSELVQQLGRVLRLREGDRVIVLDNSGMEYEVQLHTFTKRSVQGTVQEARPNRNEPRTLLTLYMALLKGKKMDIVFQKGTELGVSRFVPIVTERSVMNSVDSLSDAKLDRWEAIVREAAEQSGRGRLPEVSEPLRFDVALDKVQRSEGLSLIPWEEGGQSLRGILAPGNGTPPTEVNLFIGPEGGFEEEEVRNAQAHGALPVTLGPRILRAETAALAAAAAIFYELGEWDEPTEPLEGHTR